MRREIDAHLVEEQDNLLQVHVYAEDFFKDENETVEGVPNLYTITQENPNGTYSVLAEVNFQKGGVRVPADINGLTNEALLAIVADRLEHFQRGEFSCNENGIALKYVECALDWLRGRTKDRIARGVEGKEEK